MRTLAEDLGLALGTQAHVTKLRRHGAAPFELAQAVTLDTLGELLASGGLEALDAYLLPVDSALPHLPALSLNAAQARALSFGQALDLGGQAQPGLTRIYGPNGEFSGIAEGSAAGGLRSRRLMRSEAMNTNNNLAVKSA